MIDFVYQLCSAMLSTSAHMAAWYVFIFEFLSPIFLKDLVESKRKGVWTTFPNPKLNEGNGVGRRYHNSFQGNPVICEEP